MLQSWLSSKQLVTLWAMEEIYVNVDYVKSVDPRPSTNQTGKNFQPGREDVCYHLSLIIVYTSPFFTEFSVIRFQELREEVSWSCCSLSGTADCFPAGWTHRPRRHLWVWFSRVNVSLNLSIILLWKMNVLYQNVYLPSWLFCDVFLSIFSFVFVFLVVVAFFLLIIFIRDRIKLEQLHAS